MGSRQELTTPGETHRAPPAPTGVGPELQQRMAQAKAALEPRARSSGSDEGRAAPGFTLLELVVTLMIVALAVAVVGPAIGRSTETIRARAEVARFAALLRHTREQAITTRNAHAFVVDPQEHHVRIMAGDEVKRTRELPRDLTVEADPPPALTVRFEPEGTSTGGDFRVSAGPLHYRVTVERLTGRVHVERE